MRHLEPVIIMIRTSSALSTALLLSASLIAACGDNETNVVEIPFRAVVGSESAACGTTYSNIGTTRSTFSLLDFKLYVSDVALVRKDGTQVPLTLEQDGVWQRDDLALLDFENATGDCTQGTTETNLTVRGTAPHGDYTGVSFTLGLPVEVNHLDAATAPAPLNVPGMWWSWKGGYKFVRLDVKTRSGQSYFLHLGSAACTGDATTGYSCSRGNAPRITLPAFDLDRSEVVLDVAKLWAEVDLDRQIDMVTDFVRGCMAGPTDPECPPVLTKLGLGNDGSGGDLQSVFSVENQ